MDLTPSRRIVDIAIAEVVVEGLGPVDRHRLRRALEHDLARLVEERGVPESWTDSGARSEVTATVDWDGAGSTQGLSAAVAEQLYRGFAS